MEKATVHSFSQFENQIEFHAISLACNGPITNEEMEVTSHFDLLGTPTIYPGDSKLDEKIWNCSNLVIEYPFTFIDSISHKEIHFHCRVAYQKEDQFYTLHDIFDLIDDYACSRFSPGEVRYITSMLEEKLNLPANQITHSAEIGKKNLRKIFGCDRFSYLWGIKAEVFLQAQQDEDRHHYLKLFSKLGSPEYSFRTNRDLRQNSYVQALVVALAK